MTAWNLRIIYHDKEEYPWYGVHEVFYSKNNEIMYYTINAVDITGETTKKLRDYVDLIQKDINRAPILVESEIVCVGDEEFDYDDFMNTLEDSLEIK